MFKYFFGVALLIGYVRCQTTPFDQCTSGAPMPLNVYVEGCDVLPCELPHNTYVNFDIIFQNPNTTQTLTAKARAFVILFGVDYDLGESANACAALQNTYCPIVKDEVVLTTIRFFIDPIFPTISLPIEFRLENDDGEAVACLRTTIRVISSRSMRMKMKKEQ